MLLHHDESCELPASSNRQSLLHNPYRKRCCVCVCVCVYVCMHVCMYVDMYVCICMYRSIWFHKYVCLSVHASPGVYQLQFFSRISQFSSCAPLTSSLRKGCDQPRIRSECSTSSFADIRVEGSYGCRECCRCVHIGNWASAMLL